MITAEQCFTFGMVGALGIVFSFISNETLPNISFASLIIGALLISICVVGSIYTSFKSVYILKNEVKE